RWFREDVDLDADGVPEWQDVTQTGYAGWPLYVRDGVSIEMVESPDMVAYLLSEAYHLTQMASLVGDAGAEAKLQPRIEELSAVLQSMWDEDRFVYRDRDTHATPEPIQLLSGVRADEEHVIALDLGVPARVVVEAVGGANNKPRFSVVVSGADTDGNPAEEELAADAFTWTYGRGSATTKTIFSRVDRIQATGLSRVFRLNATSTGLVALDMNTMLPIITGVLSDGQVASLVETLQSSLLTPNGLALYPPEDDPRADDSGVWVFWNVLICEALFTNGYSEFAVDILRRLLRVQTAVLRETGVFTMFYDQDDMRGMGTQLDLTGVIPVNLLFIAMGVTVRSDGTVLISESFAWGEPITVEQFGIRIERSNDGVTVTYPGEAAQSVEAGVAIAITPPEDWARPTVDVPSTSEKPVPIPEAMPTIPISIEVDIEDDADTSQ
ncbi:MAG: hypothetical protein AAF125_19895, partial [Chloroflexota bacterium]